MHLSKDDLLRYNRQIIIPEFGQSGQEKLLESSVLVIGAGGLGAPILQYLTAAGVGKIGIIDFDEVSLSNLQRQVLFNTQELGKSKAETAEKKLSQLNPTVQFKVYKESVNSLNAKEILKDYDLVVDGSDNLPTRYLVNDACYLLGKPLIYGAIFRFEGQVSVFNALKADGSRGPNYRDLFPTPPPPEMVPSCSEGGVLGVLPGIIGSMMANEAIKVLCHMGTSLSGKLFVFDALDFSTHQLNVQANSENPLSGENPGITDLIDYEAFCMGEVKEQSIREITVQELKERMENGPVELIDVREDYEYQIANLGGKLIPLNKVLNQMDEIPRDREVVVMCKMGGRSTKAIELLQQEGFDQLINLKGGINAWQKEIDPQMTAY
ncbi:molybdopterin-synthase adenylyltransferase MoeB [Roseivirga sp.]|uniref:molybdopterin-synthase adenylyltransferase MoeB n=1 Tax=Roseivirga sp. TaxID=1964215 RepID=UPI003B52794B